MEAGKSRFEMYKEKVRENPEAKIQVINFGPVQFCQVVDPDVIEELMK